MQRADGGYNVNSFIWRGKVLETSSDFYKLSLCLFSDSEYLILKNSKPTKSKVPVFPLRMSTIYSEAPFLSSKKGVVNSPDIAIGGVCPN
ncbi:hypothetical protein CEXT_505461 [Caerostris extrusa]|uniref:Uncharacterized protein n=1 Tax=Caerostris extrusa TaxID=172846 RepID=A0AAV4V2E7_CAEEX|nr:hypothetical protein CEXT_505461 [Caerostris extrusa]